MLPPPLLLPLLRPSHSAAGHTAPLAAALRLRLLLLRTEAALHGALHCEPVAAGPAAAAAAERKSAAGAGRTAEIAVAETGLAEIAEIAETEVAAGVVAGGSDAVAAAAAAAVGAVGVARSVQQQKENQVD